MKFIELFGMPGTGKTYLIENLREFNKLEKIHLYLKKER